MAVNHATSIAKAWLGRQYLSDPEVRADFDNLMRAPDHRPLAFAMRKIVGGAAMGELTAEEKATVDYDRIARGMKALRTRYERPTHQVRGAKPLLRETAV